MGYDSFICDLAASGCDALICDSTYLCGTRLIHFQRDALMGHDSFIWDVMHSYVTRLVHMGQGYFIFDVMH